MLTDFHLLQDLEQFAFSADGPPFCIYGDPAYPINASPSPKPIQKCSSDPPDAGIQCWNQLRKNICGMVIRRYYDYFKFLEFKKNLKIGLSSVDKMYLVSAILRNALTCLYWNQTSDFFQCDPPELIFHTEHQYTSWIVEL